MRFADCKITAEVDDDVGLVTFCNPEKRNVMSLDMWQGLDEALACLEADDAVRVVLVTGAGQDAFVSGADISQFEPRSRTRTGATWKASRKPPPPASTARTTRRAGQRSGRSVPPSSRGADGGAGSYRLPRC